MTSLSTLFSRYGPRLHIQPQPLQRFLKDPVNAPTPSPLELRRGLIIILAQGARATAYPYRAAAQRLSSHLQLTSPQSQLLLGTLKAELEQTPHLWYHLDRTLCHSLRTNLRQRDNPRPLISHNELLHYSTELLTRPAYHRYLRKSQKHSPCVHLFRQVLQHGLP